MGKNAMKGGLGDSDPSVRDLAYCALVKVEILKKELAEKFVKTLKKARKEKYETIRKEELRRIEASDSYSVGVGVLKVSNLRPSKAMNISKGAKSPKSPKKEKK